MSELSHTEPPIRRALYIPHRRRWLAETARDADGVYPAPGATVYPIVFLASSYTESAGNQTINVGQRSAQARAVAMNLVDPDPLGYLPENTVVRVWRVGHRYYMYRRLVYGCLYENDQVDRADGDNPGTIWTETAGDWDVLNETLVTSSPNAELTCATLAPGASKKYLIGIAVQFDTDGDVARVKLNGGAQFAELERINALTGRLRLYDGTSCKQSVDVPLADWTQFILCSKGTGVYLGIGGGPLLSLAVTVTSAVVSLATGACTGTIAFDAFTLSKHYDDDNACPQCGDPVCTWFKDWGIPLGTTGNPSPTDYTLSGTWSYEPGNGLGPAIQWGGLKCTAAGSAQVIVAHPAGEATGSIIFRLPTLAAGTTLSVDPDGGGVVSVLFSADGKIRLFKSGVEYSGGGVWTGVGTARAIRIRCNGTIVDVHTLDIPVPTGNVVQCMGTVAYTPTAMAPKFTVAASGACSAIFGRVAILKTSIASGNCTPADSTCCNGCQPGTMRTEGTATVNYLTSHVYGCTCPGSTAVPIVACDPSQLAALTYFTGLDVPAGSCTWLGSLTTAGVTITVGVVVVQDGANYRLSAAALWQKYNPCGFLVSALFEETIVGAQPDCTVDIAGSVPWLSARDHWGEIGFPSACTAESATLSLAFP